MKHDVDISVGQEIRLARHLAGMTQDDLAQKIGVKFQQLQKYESGTNRVSASRLWMIAQALNLPIGHFFAKVGEDKRGGLVLDRQTMELVAAFQPLDQEVRDALLRLAKSMV